MRKRITLKHIANEFNVSITTVSKAINDSYEISTKTKAKIQKYAKEHYYKPNSIALNLLKRKTKTIGVIIPNILNNFFSKVFVGIEKVASERGYNIITCISNESYEKEVSAMELLKSGALDGFIFSIAEETQIKQNYSHFQAAINEGIPIVMFDRVTDQIDCDKVIVNDEEGAYNAVKHFIESGCKNIAIISTIDNLSVGKLRLEGYKKGLREANIPIDETLILKVDEFNDLDTSLKILLGTKKVDAMLCLEEDSTINTLRMVQSKGYQVPEDISIIGFTNGKLPRYVTPSITTISQHGIYVGETAAKILIDKLENDDASDGTLIKPVTKVIKTSLIERETTRQKVYHK